MPEDASTREELQRLKQEYAAKLEGRVSAIEDAADSLGEAWDSDRVESLYQQVHRLAGSSAIFGFHDVSRAAQVLEVALLDSLDDCPGAQKRLRDELASLLKALHRAAREGPG
jgi:HPt (histidine-containing phosphotransfer) domain-containing protein